MKLLKKNSPLYFSLFVLYLYEGNLQNKVKLAFKKVRSSKGLGLSVEISLTVLFAAAKAKAETAVRGQSALATSVRQKSTRNIYAQISTLVLLLLKV